jgi:TatA/E family protein of Tat protein translocase
MFGLGFDETLLVLAVVLIAFGPRRIPELMQAVGKGMREFRRALAGVSDELSGALPYTPPPHSVLAGTGSDPNAISNSAPAAIETVAYTEPPAATPGAAPASAEPLPSAASPAPAGEDAHPPVAPADPLPDGSAAAP